VLVVTEELSIATEKVTEMLSLIETPPWLSVGEIDETVGAVVSVVVLSVVVLSVVVLSVVVSSVEPVAEYSSLSSPQEMTVRLKKDIRKMNKYFFIFTSTPKVKYYWLREPYIYHN
jgi:hypothetical protein